MKDFQHLNALPTRIPNIFQNMDENILSMLSFDRKGQIPSTMQGPLCKEQIRKIQDEPKNEK